jgi:hypothetical protein
MAIQEQSRTAMVISVHDEPEAIRFNPPNVLPGNYLIPGLHAEPKTFEACSFSFPGKPAHIYARKWVYHSQPVIELKVVDAKTFVYTTGEQKVDEYGQRLEPPVQRFGMPIRAEEVANEIERQYGHMGIVACQGETPTAEEIEKARQLRLKWLHSVIETTNAEVSKRGLRQATDQSRRAAWELHKLGRLSPLPDWAQINPSAEMRADTFNCSACGGVVRKEAVQCPNCRAIYDWKRAVDLGLKAPSEVPPSKREEAGLEALATA